MKRLVVCLGFTMLSFSIYAQQTGCNCAVALGKLVTKVEQEYPGFSVKTVESAPYSALKQQLRTAAQKADGRTCEKLLKRYTDFFKDPHLWVGANGSPFSSGEDGAATSVNFDIIDFQKKIGLTQDVLEGVWSTDGYKIGIKKGIGNDYTGFIIEAEATSWKAGNIKFKLFGDGSFEYLLRDRSKRKGRYRVHKEGILFLDAVGMALVRQIPTPSVNKAQLEEKLQELVGFYVKKLTDKTSILKLPSFEYQHLGEINELISQNRLLIEESENLIIDVRGNPGGTTDAYKNLLPYIFEKPIRNTAAEFLATKTYIGNLEAYKKTLDKNAPTDEIDKNIARLQANLGKFVNFSDSVKPIYIEEVPKVAKSPQHIVILADKGTGSSAEYFLFITKQSKKVKLLGTPSYGALDFGNAYLIDFGCTGYQLLMPTYRAMRLPDYPIDNIGIQPDMYLDSSVEDWVAFALKYVEE